MHSEVASQRQNFRISGSIHPIVTLPNGHYDTVNGEAMNRTLRNSSIFENQPRQQRPESTKSTGAVDADTKETTSEQATTALGPPPLFATRDFEKVLFRSPVYSRNADRTESITTFHSTIYTEPSSILGYITLADVSIVSVLRLPAPAEVICNRSYTADGDNDGDGDDPASSENATNEPRSGRSYTYLIPTHEMFAFKPHCGLNDADRYAKELSAHLDIPIRSLREQFITAALRRANVNHRDGPIRLYLRTGISSRLVMMEESPLMLLATAATNIEDPSELIVVMPGKFCTQTLPSG